MEHLTKGDIVLLSPASDFWDDCEGNVTNPRNTKGIIIKVEMDQLWIEVTWMSGVTNCYSDYDLVRSELTEQERGLFKMICPDVSL